MPARLGAVLCVVALGVVCQSALAEPMHHYLNLRRGTSSVIGSDDHLITIERTSSGTYLWAGTPVTCKQMNTRFRNMWAKDKSIILRAMCHERWPLIPRPALRPVPSHLPFHSRDFLAHTRAITN